LPPSTPVHVERFNPALRPSERLGFRQVEDKGVYLLMEWSSDKSQALRLRA
jgi:hypothetical protein